MKYFVICNHLGDIWPIGLFENFNSGYGEILKKAFFDLESINGDIPPEENHEKSCLFLSRGIDGFGGYYEIVKATYTATAYNNQIEVEYMIFEVKE